MTAIDYLELEFQIQAIKDKFRNKQIQREVAERELKLLGLSNDQILYALGDKD